MLCLECYARLFLFEAIWYFIFFYKGKKLCCVVFIRLYAFFYDIQAVYLCAEFRSNRSLFFFISFLDNLCSSCCIILRNSLYFMLLKKFSALLKRVRMRVSNFYVSKLI